MKTVLVRKASDATYRTLTPAQKAEAALETLRGGRSVIDIARHWQIDPSDLLSWQSRLVEGAASLFEEKNELGHLELKQAQMANEALVQTVFEHIDARQASQQAAGRLHRLLDFQEQSKEEERKSIAREVHDALGQNLMAIRIDISMLHDKTRVRHPHLHRRASAVMANLDDSIKTVRSVINALRPFELELGLPAVLQWQLNRFERGTGKQVHLEVEGYDENGAPIDDAVTLVFFRTLQESLHGIVQHANVNKVDVILRRGSHGLTLLVSDDGDALSGDQEFQRNLGLASVRERVEILGGHISVHYPDIGGTQLHCWIPLPLSRYL